MRDYQGHQLLQHGDVALSQLLQQASALSGCLWHWSLHRQARLFVRHPQAASSCCYLFDVHLIHIRMVQLGKARGLQCLIWQATLSLSDAEDQENERA